MAMQSGWVKKMAEEAARPELQAAVDAGEEAGRAAEEDGYVTRTAHDERMTRQADYEGKLPGYEQALESYGFDTAEYEQALTDQRRDVEELARIQRERAIMAAGNAPNKESLLNEANRQIETLETDIAGRQDAAIQTQPDFARHSRPRPEFAKQDAFYAYANFRETQDNGGHITMPDEALKAQFMTDEERSVYNYYYYFDRQNGTDQAGEYLKRIDNRLSYRQSNYTAEQAYKMGREHPAAGLVVSALTTVLEPAGLIQTGWDTLRGKDTNPYGAAFAPGRIKGSIRSGGASGMGAVGGFLYNTAGSLGDMGAAALTGPLMPLTMAGSAGSAAAYDVGTRGGSSGDMLKVGLPAAIVEWGTEKLGFDRLTSFVRAGMKGGKGFLATIKGMGRAWAASFLPEALEELPGNPMNTLVDNWVMDIDSTWNIQGRRLQEEEKLTEEQANRRLWGQLLKETGLEGLAGGIAGGLAGGAGMAIGSLNAGKITQEIMTEYPGMDEALVESVVQQEMGLKGRNEGELRAFEESLEEAQAVKEQPDPFGAGVLALKKTAKGPVIRENEQGEGQAKAPEGALPAAVATGFERVAGGEATVTLDNGETAALGDLTFDSIEMKQAYEEAASYGDTKTARSFLTGWQYSRMPIGAYGKAFEHLFDRGRNGRRMQEGLLRGRVAQIAYEAGQAYRQGVEARLDTPQAVSAAIQSRIAHLPGELKPGFAGGVVMQTRQAKLSSFQAVQAALMDEYGKRNGVTYVVVDSLGGAINGFYKDGVIYVAADAQEGNLTRAATHEGWHYLKESLGPESLGIRALENFVLSRLQSSGGYDLETRIGQIRQIYESRAGQKLDRAGALEEIVADSLFDVFSRRENLEALLARDETAAKGLIGWVKRFGQQMKEALRRIGLKSPEARAMEESVAYADAMVEMYNDLMAEAKQKKTNPQEGAGSDKQAASAKYSVKFNQDKPWNEQINSYVKAWKAGKTNGIRNHSLVLSMTGYPSLTQEGIPDLPLVMEPSVANKALRMEKGSKSAHGEQGISVDTLLGMPEQIKDAKLILRYQRKNGNRAAIVFGTENADPKAISEANLERYAGKPVCYAIEENVTNDEGIKVNVVTSVHVRVSPEWVGETVLREDPDAVISFEGKKMSRPLITSAEIISAANELIDLYLSIYHPDLIVNRKTTEGGKFSITGERAENAKLSKPVTGPGDGKGRERPEDDLSGNGLVPGNGQAVAL